MTTAPSMIDCNIRPLTEGTDSASAATCDTTSCLVQVSEPDLEEKEEEEDQIMLEGTTEGEKTDTVIENQQSPTSTAEVFEGVEAMELKKDVEEISSAKDDDGEIQGELTETTTEAPEDPTMNEGGELQSEGDSVSQLINELDSMLPDPSPSPARDDVRKSIVKGRAELCKSRQKAHASKLEGEAASTVPSVSVSRSPSSRKLLSASAHVPPKIPRSRSNDFEVAPSSEHTRRVPIRRFASSRRFAAESEHQSLPFSSHQSSDAGSLATPRRKNSKKLSMEGMEGLNKASKNLDVLCTPKRTSSDRKLRMNVQAMMDANGEGSSGRRHISRSKSYGSASVSTPGSNITRPRRSGEKLMTKHRRPQADSTADKQASVSDQDSTSPPYDEKFDAVESALQDVESEDAGMVNEGRENSDTTANYPTAIRTEEGEDKGSSIPIEPGPPSTLEKEFDAKEDDADPALAVDNTNQTTENGGNPVIPELEDSRENEDAILAFSEHERSSGSVVNNEELGTSLSSGLGKSQTLGGDSANRSLDLEPAKGLESPNDPPKATQSFSLSGGDESGGLPADWGFGNESSFASSSAKANDTSLVGITSDQEDCKLETIASDESTVPAGKGPWTCAACLYPNVDKDHLFCGMCGTGRDWCCPWCETTNKSTFKFCGSCGTQKGRPILNGTTTIAESTSQTVKLPERKHSKSTREKAKQSDRSVASEKRAKAGPRRTTSKRSSGELRTASFGSKSEDARKLENRSSRGRSRADADEFSVASNRASRRPSLQSKGGDKPQRCEVARVKSRSKSRERTTEKRSDKARRSRNSSSVPPAERKPRSSVEKRPAKGASEGSVVGSDGPHDLHRSNSFTRMEMDKASGWDTLDAPSDNEEDMQSVGFASKPKRKKNLALKKPWKSSAEEGEAILHSDTNSTDRDYVRETVDRVGDVLSTPSIKKRLLKMGKFGGKKMPNASDLLVGFDSGSSAKNDANGPDELVAQKGFMGDKADGFAPMTPSFKKRLLKKMNWKKAEDSGKPKLPTEEQEGAAEEVATSDIESPRMHPDEADMEDLEPFEGLSSGGLVFTAKDVRLNRPVTSRRQQVSSHPQENGSSKKLPKSDGRHHSDRKHGNNHGQPTRRVRRDDRDRRPVVVHQDSGNTAEMSSSQDPLEEII